MDTAKTHLVDTAWLATHLNDSHLRIFDVTVHLRPAVPGPYTVESGHADYLAGHIPGASFLDLGKDLSDSASDLRFTMPAPTQIERVLSGVGLGNEHQAIIYSTSTPMWATRFWWMLRASGFDNAAVLDGGFAKWTGEGRPLAKGGSRYGPAQFKAKPNPKRWADKQEVLSAIGDGSVCTINALSGALHRGEGEVNYGRKGHIKGSVNVPYASIVNKDGTYKAPAELRGGFDAVKAFDRQRVICYCGGGISATMDALALDMLGHPNVAVYDGSMSEWVRDASLPMDTGA